MPARQDAHPEFAARGGRNGRKPSCVWSRCTWMVRPFWCRRHRISERAELAWLTRQVVDSPGNEHWRGPSGLRSTVDQHLAARPLIAGKSVPAEDRLLLLLWTLGLSSTFWDSV